MEQPNALEPERWVAQASAFFRATFLRGLPPASSLSGRGKASPSEVSEELSSSCSSTDGNVVMCKKILITQNVSKWQFPTVKSINSQVKFVKKVIWKYLDGPACNCTFLLCACNCWMTWICFSNHDFVRHEVVEVSDSGKLTDTFHSWKASYTSYTSYMQATASSFCRSCSCNSACRWQVLSVLGLQVVCSHVFQVHNIQHVTYPQSVLSTCNQVHSESAKACLTQNLFLPYPRPSLIPRLDWKFQP